LLCHAPRVCRPGRIVAIRGTKRPGAERKDWNRKEGAGKSSASASDRGDPMPSTRRARSGARLLTNHDRQRLGFAAQRTTRRLHVGYVIQHGRRPHAGRATSSFVLVHRRRFATMRSDLSCGTKSVQPRRAPCGGGAAPRREAWSVGAALIHAAAARRGGPVRPEQWETGRAAAALPTTDDEARRSAGGADSPFPERARTTRGERAVAPAAGTRHDSRPSSTSFPGVRHA